MRKDIYQNLVLTEQTFLSYIQDYQSALSKFNEQEKDILKLYFAIFEADSFPDMLFITPYQKKFYCPAFHGSWERHIDGLKLSFKKDKNKLMSYGLIINNGVPKIPLVSMLDSTPYLALSHNVLACLENGHQFLLTYIDWITQPDENNAKKMLQYVQHTSLGIPLLLSSVNSMTSAVKLYEILNEEQKQFPNHSDAEDLLNVKRRTMEKEETLPHYPTLSDMASIFRIYKTFEQIESRLKIICSYHDLQKLPQKETYSAKRKI